MENFTASLPPIFFLFQRVDSNIATRLINFEDEIKVFAELFLTR